MLKRSAELPNSLCTCSQENVARVRSKSGIFGSTGHAEGFFFMGAQFTSTGKLHFSDHNHVSIFASRSLRLHPCWECFRRLTHFPFSSRLKRLDRPGLVEVNHGVELI